MKNELDREIEPEFVEVAGRKFVAAQHTTFEQDLYLMDRIRSAGVDKMPTSVSEEGELTDAAEELLYSAYRTGHLFEILAGLMVEVDVPWNKDEADLNAEFFAGLSNPEDKKALHGVMVGAVLSFFVGAGGSLQISQKSSERKGKGPPAPPAVRGGRRSTKSGTK
jgi:hypothetical protein